MAAVESEAVYTRGQQRTVSAASVLDVVAIGMRRGPRCLAAVRRGCCTTSQLGVPTEYRKSGGLTEGRVRCNPRRLSRPRAVREIEFSDDATVAGLHHHGGWTGSTRWSARPDIPSSPG
jgi:hypothetical protein